MSLNSRSSLAKLLSIADWCQPNGRTSALIMINVESGERFTCGRLTCRLYLSEIRLIAANNFGTELCKALCCAELELTNC